MLRMATVVFAGVAIEQTPTVAVPAAVATVLT